MSPEEFYSRCSTGEGREWFDTRPKNVKEAVLTTPPFWCYRKKGKASGSGHYWIYSYDEGLDGSVTVKLIHGKDSFLPGTGVFGVDYRELVKCDCGRWEWEAMEEL